MKDEIKKRLIEVFQEEIKCPSGRIKITDEWLDKAAGEIEKSIEYIIKSYMKTNK